jgi:hydroxypyruvate reductase
MARVACERSQRPLEGLVVAPYRHVPPSLHLSREIEILEAGHPVPDANSLRAADKALELARGLGEGDRLLVLLSGGGSSLLAAPAPGLSLADKQEVTRALLGSGAPIGEINVVRKHLSRIKGGRLALAAAPAGITTWLISDVPGDDPGLVASGPTLGDDSTLADARGILQRHGLPPQPALDDPANETPSPSEIASGEVRLLAAAADALAAAGRMARSLGYEVTLLGNDLQGDARHVGAGHAEIALSSRRGRQVILSGGETGVALGRSTGRGGRNLEFLLSLALGLRGTKGIFALACDTDGLDGTAPAAGALVFPDTLERASALGLDAQDHLARHDSFAFFERLGDLVVTGPTLTNVNDFRALLLE